MKSFAIPLFIILSFQCHSQTLEQLNARKKDLLTRQKQINDSLKIVDEAIRRGEVEKLKNGVQFRMAVMARNSALKTGDVGDVIGSVHAGDTVKVIGWRWFYLQVLRDNQMGYVQEFDVVQDDELKKFIAFMQERFNAELKNENHERDKAHNKELAEKDAKDKKEQAARDYAAKQKRAKLITDTFSAYDKTTVQKIIDGKIWIGMTGDMARFSWGNPRSINKTVTNNRVSEQWVYSSDYLYFENGMLVSYQTSR